MCVRTKTKYALINTGNTGIANTYMTAFTQKSRFSKSSGKRMCAWRISLTFSYRRVMTFLYEGA